MAGFNHYPAIAAALDKALSQIVRKTAFDIQARAQSGAPVDTGFLRSSIYTVTSDGSTYAAAGTPPGDSYLFTEVTGADEYTAYVAVGANYGIYLEFGTRYMPAQPYFYPAVEAVRPGFDAALAAIESKLAV